MGVEAPVPGVGVAIVEMVCCKWDAELEY